MNTLQKTRIDNLRRLLRSRGSQTDIANEIGVSSSYINHLLTGYRAMGEKTARKIEKAAGKPPLWLDQNNDLSETHKEVIAKIKEFPEDHLHILSAFVDSILSLKKKNQ